MATLPSYAAAGQQPLPDLPAPATLGARLAQMLTAPPAPFGSSPLAASPAGAANVLAPPSLAPSC
eukprot:13093374-Alexandrium_andersonii.AAC.1